MQNLMPHQYIDRKTGEIRTEKLFSDEIINFIYSSLRENAQFCFNLLVSGKSTAFLSYLNFDFSFGNSRKKAEKFINELSIDMSECLRPPDSFNTAGEVFLRQIRYWECRPLPYDTQIHSKSRDNGFVLSPSDSKIVVGTLRPDSNLFIKDKFFRYDELLGDRSWTDDFRNGDFAIFRLTPDEYHYNHVPVSGVIEDFYEVRGKYHSCNPGAVVKEITPYSLNDRVVTVIDTDVDGGSHVGKVAMIEVTAMMIGRVEQCYSRHAYDSPVTMTTGLFMEKGQPKSLFRPGSSTVILIFEHGRINFSEDILSNMKRRDAVSRFSTGFSIPMVETSLRVREEIGRRKVAL